MKNRTKTWLAAFKKRVTGEQGWLYVLVGVGLPFLVLVCLVAVFGVNVPILDQWELVDLFKKHHSGELGFSDFFAQHNEHRLLFPRLVMFGLAVMSDWNIAWEMAASLLVAAVSFLFIYKILVKTFSDKFIRFLAVVSIGIVFFSPIQWENWLWGWQIQWHLHILGLVVAVWALAVWEATPVKRILVAALAATVATYSLASGFFVWVICLPLMWYAKPLRRWVWPWVITGVAAVSLHYIGYHDPANHPAKTLLLQQPFEFIEYLFAYLAHPLSIHFVQAVLMAPLFLLLIGLAVRYIYMYSRSALSSSLLPWLCLGGYAFLAAMSTAATRVGFGPEQAFSSRYTTISQLLLIATLVFLYKLVELKPARTIRRLVTGIILTLMGLVLLNCAKGVVQMRDYTGQTRQAKHCAQHASTPADECLYKLYPLPDVTWERLLYLRSLHWTGL